MCSSWLLRVWSCHRDLSVDCGEQLLGVCCNVSPETIPIGGSDRWLNSIQKTTLPNSTKLRQILNLLLPPAARSPVYRTKAPRGESSSRWRWEAQSPDW